MLPLRDAANHMDVHFGVNKQIKAKKRQLERERRQRINERLEKLKIIVMKQLGNDVGYYPPMEKADILELAIRCLEGKEESSNEVLRSSNDVLRSSNKDKENTSTEASKPLQRLQINNTPSPNRKRKLEITPIRMKCFKTNTKQFPKCEPDENSSHDMEQFFADFKPLLQHPIKSFSLFNQYDDAIYINQSNQLSAQTDDSLKIDSIWRPWIS